MRHAHRTRRWLGAGLLLALVALSVPAEGAIAPSVINVATNPSVETNSAGWFPHNLAVTDADASRTTAWAKSGAWSMHFAGTSGSTDLGGTGIKGVIGTYVLPANGAVGYTVTAGQTYTSSAWVNVVTAPPAGSPGVWQEIFFYDAFGRQLAQVNGSSLQATVTTGVQRVSVTGRAPTGAMKMQVLTVMASSADLAAMEFYVDAELITTGATLTDYFDGSTRIAGRICSWLGQPHASASLSMATTLR